MKSARARASRHDRSSEAGRSDAALDDVRKVRSGDEPRVAASSDDRRNNPERRESSRCGVGQGRDPRSARAVAFPAASTKPRARFGSRAKRAMSKCAVCGNPLNKIIGCLRFCFHKLEVHIWFLNDAS